MSQTKAQLISDLVQALNFTGTASAPANGLFLSASNQLKLATASTERLKIDGTEVVVNDTGASVDFRVEGDTVTHLLFADASTDRVGIGTSSPGEKLEVSGEIKLTNFLKAAGDLLLCADHDNSLSGSALRFCVDGEASAEKVRIDEDGKVHVGLTNGSGQFNVKNSNDATTNALEIYNDNGVRNAAFSQSSTGDATMDLRTNAASQTVLIRSNGTSHFNGGNVGIGTSSPSAALHINTASSGLPKIRLEHTGAGNDVFEITSGLAGISNSGFGIYDVGETAYRLAIDTSGNVGVGTTTIGEKFTIGDGDLKFFHSNAGSAHRTTFIEFGNSSNRITSEMNYGSDSSSNYTAGYKFSTKNYTGSAFETINALNIQANGNIGIGTLTPTALLNVNTPASGTTTAIQISRTTHGNVGKFINSTGALEIQSNKQLILSSDPDQGMTAEGSKIEFKIDAGEKATLTSDGNLTITDGNLIVANGHGIDFSATGNGGSSPSGVSELFNDYETGTFTVTLANSLTVHTQTKLTYTKIGNKCHISGQFRIQTGGSDLTINNLPFTTVNTGNTDETFSVGFVGLYYVDMPSDGGASGEIYSKTQKNDNNIFFVYNRDSSDPNSHTATANGYYTISHWYTVST